MSTLGNNLLEMYWRQYGRYNPIITDGLIAYEPFDAPRARTLIGGYEIGKGTNIDYIMQDGVPCIYGVSSIKIIKLPDVFTISQWNCAYKRNYAFFGYWASSSNWLYISNQENETQIQMSASPLGAIKVEYTPKTWIHLVACVSHNIIQFYMDGVLKNARTNIPSFNSGTLSTSARQDSLDVGSYALGAGFRLYNRVLSQDEITRLAHEFTPTT